MQSTNLTFENLKPLMLRRITDGAGLSNTSLPNLSSALNAFLSERQIPSTAAIGSIFRSSYYDHTRAHAEALRLQGRPPAYVANRRALLAQWRRCVIDFDRYCAVDLKDAHPFQRAVLDILERGFTKKGLARAAGIPAATLGRWCVGRLPQARTLSYVPRLERHLGLHPGSLGDLLPVRPAASDGNTGVKPIAYRERLSIQQAQPYAVKKPNERLRDEWMAFLQYKVSELDLDNESEDPSDKPLRRSANGRWTSTTAPVSRKRESNWYGWYRGRFVPTACIKWGLVSQFIGWLALDQASGGKGMPAEEAMTLANFTRRPLLRDYVEWRRERSGGLAHGGLESFLMFASSLCNPRTGYLTQSWRDHNDAANPEAERLWRERCTNTFESIAKLRAVLSDDSAPSRDALEPLQHILALPNPLDAIADMLTRMDASKPYSSGSREAVWARDKLLVKLMASNPLRDKNVSVPPTHLAPAITAVLSGGA